MSDAHAATVIRTEIATVVNRPRNEVFSYVVDFSNLPQYDRYVETAEKTSEGPIAKGSTWTHRRVQGRRRFDAPIRLAEYEQDRRFVMVSGSNGFDVRSTMRFDAHGDKSNRMAE